MVTMDLMTQMVLLTNMTLMDAKAMQWIYQMRWLSEAAMDLVSQLLVVDPRSSMSPEDGVQRSAMTRPL